MDDQENTETAPQLVSSYNALVAQAGGIGLTSYRELRVFHDKPTAVARIAQLESAIRAHESGERAEAARDEASPQLKYIGEERKRYKKLDQIRLKIQGSKPVKRGYESVEYKTAAHALGVHAQQEDEIRGRLAQLDEMEQKEHARLQSSSNERIDPITNATENAASIEKEYEQMAKKTKAKKSAKIAKPAKAPRKVAAAKSSTNGEKHGPRAGSKTEVVRGLLTRKGGCTSREVLDATGWPAVSMPAMAKACGLELRREKEKGSSTQYYGS